jgi:hypothetical protein
MVRFFLCRQLRLSTRETYGSQRYYIILMKFETF